MRSIVTKALEVVPTCDFCAVVQRTHGKLRTGASTSPVIAACDDLQYQLGEGPSLDVSTRTEICLVADTKRDVRWPRWRTRVADYGIGSVLAIRLSTSAQNLGVLSLYSTRSSAFDVDDIGMAFAFATHAAVALYAARQSAGLGNAVETRHLVGVAQGILMNRYGLGLEPAFRVLRRYSNGSNLKLRDVARLVAQQGDLPGAAGPYLVPASDGAGQQRRGR